MPLSIRTQIYLTQEQRDRLDAIGRQEQKSLARVIRDSIDAYVAPKGDPDLVLRETFGSIPDFEVPGREQSDRFG